MKPSKNPTPFQVCITCGETFPCRGTRQGTHVFKAVKFCSAEVMRPIFTSSEWASIANDLRVAAERYRQDANEVRPSSTRLAEQVERQADAAAQRAERIERGVS